MVFNGLDIMKHGFKNHIFSTKAVDFSLLKSRALVDFSKLKSGDPIGFQGLPALWPTWATYTRRRAAS